MSENFEHWGIVEIMGHQRIAGRISEQAIGGVSFVRVDVPETGGIPAFTKMFGPGAIYAITVTDEETARGAAGLFIEKPVDTFSARAMLQIKADEDDRPSIDNKCDLPF